MPAEEIIREIAATVARRRVKRGYRYFQTATRYTAFSHQWLVAHGLMPDEIITQAILDFVWKERALVFGEPPISALPKRAVA